jgi:PhnB protein
VQPGPQPAAISVMLIVPDAEAAIAWYREALGATERWNLGGVAGLALEDAPFLVHEAVPDKPGETSPDAAGVTSVRIELFVADPDAVRARAIAAGATPGAEMTDHAMPWGNHRQGGFQDPFGHRWSVGDHSPLR